MPSFFVGMDGTQTHHAGVLRLVLTPRSGDYPQAFTRLQSETAISPRKVPSRDDDPTSFHPPYYNTPQKGSSQTVCIT